MSELKEIAALLFKNISDALLTTAHQLSQSNSQPSIIKSDFIENPKMESIEIGDEVMITDNKKRYWATVTGFSGELISLENHMVSKSWTVHIGEVMWLNKR